MIYLITKRKIGFEGITNSTLGACMEYLADRSWVSLDTETRGFQPKDEGLLLLQIGDYENQYVIDVTTVDITPLKPLLHNRTDLTVLMHNAKFDWRWLYHYGIDIRTIYDTFLGEAILTTGFDTDDRGLSLKSCGMKYCNVELDKEARGLIHKLGLVKRIIEYAADDVKYLNHIRERQLVELEKYKLMNVVNLEMRFVRVLALMEYKGVLVDADKWIAVAKQTEENKKELETRLNDALYDTYVKLKAICDKLTPDEKLLTDGQMFLSRLERLSKFTYTTTAAQLDLFADVETRIKINWGSPTQKIALLKALDLNVKSVERKSLVKIRRKHPLIPLLIEHAEQAKLVSSFGKKFIRQNVNPVTGMVHPNYFQIVSTGRISCSDPNLLNIPGHGALAKKIRAAFVARPGYKIVGGDYSNFELRIIAEFSDDMLWLRVFREQGDLHKELCCLTFKIPPEDVNKPFPLKPTQTYRETQKTIDFGLAYGMTKYKLGDLLDITPAKAQGLIDQFFNVIPAVKNFLEGIAIGAQTYGYVRTAPPFGRIRWFPKLQGARDNNDESVISAVGREAKNTPIQGTNGDVIKLALCNIQDTIDRNNYPARIILSIYDEIQTEVAESFAEEWRTILESEMIKAAEVVLHKVPIKVDVKINDFWQK